MYSSSSLSCARERWWRMGDGPVWCLTKCRSAARHGEVGASNLYAPIILGSGQQAMSASYASTAAGLMGVWVESGCLSSCGANETNTTPNPLLANAWKKNAKDW
uniref:Uncharacterized protein n=1 Tax=Oryza barthii TaxID=65489 RepID=A0A0D3H9G1_9ORYZ